MEERITYEDADIRRTGRTAAKYNSKKPSPTTKNREARKGCAAKASGPSSKAVIAGKGNELTKYAIIVHTLLALSP
jgi:hypothetical protein